MGEEGGPSPNPNPDPHPHPHPHPHPEPKQVLEPSFYAHALARPADAAAARGGGTELRRFSYLGGNFGTPHRDHASSDCFG